MLRCLLKLLSDGLILGVQLFHFHLHTRIRHLSSMSSMTKMHTMTVATSHCQGAEVTCFWETGTREFDQDFK